MRYPGPLVDAEWLSHHCGSPNAVVVHATVHLPDTGRNAAAEYAAEHIPGALFFDFSRIADPDNPLWGRVPPKKLFEREVGLLGIDNGKHVVAYDTPGLYSAARVWWLFRLYGYDTVSVLNGGLKAWSAAGLPRESGVVHGSPTNFIAGETRDLLALSSDVLKASQAGEQILDARTAQRFAGTEKDRYPGTRLGRIPNSKNLYWAGLLDPDTGRLLPLDELRRQITEAGISFEKPVIASCGSGLTACILALALHLNGHEDWRVYDGSYEEWGRNPRLPVETDG